VVAVQSVNVIKTLLAVDTTPNAATTNMRLTIPYFGTINIGRPQVVAGDNTNIALPVQPQPYPEQNEAWQGLNYPQQDTAPLVQFQSSQFAPLPPDQPFWNDTLYFDSLLNTDIEGNWLLGN